MTTPTVSAVLSARWNWQLTRSLHQNVAFVKRDNIGKESVILNSHPASLSEVLKISVYQSYERNFLNLNWRQKYLLYIRDYILVLTKTFSENSCICFSDIYKIKNNTRN